MQPDSNGQATSLSDEVANVQLLQAMVLAGLEGLVTWLPGLRGQLLAIQTCVPANGPASVLEPMLDDLDRDLAAAAKAAETVFGYAEQAVWVPPAVATSTRGRKPPPLDAVKALILRALVEYLKPNAKTTIRPKEAVLCRIIRDKGLRSGKGIHDKTLSRWLNENEPPMTYDAVLEELWLQAQQLAGIFPSREVSG